MQLFRLLVVFVIVVLGGHISYSQNDNLDLLLKHRENAASFREYLELAVDPTYISGTRFFDYHSGIKKAYLFNGNFQLPFTIGGKKYCFGKKKSWYHAFQFTPEIKVRIFQNDTTFKDKSKPVRTPSYIPKISYFLTNTKYWSQEHTKHNFYIGVSALHHSNGGDGWEFEYGGDSTVNIYDGSFSESLYFQVAIGGLISTQKEYTGRLNRLHHAKTKKGQLVVESADKRDLKLGWKITSEFHPRYFANQKFYDAQVYGGNRVVFSLFHQLAHQYDEFHFKSGKWLASKNPFIQEFCRFSLHLEYITDLTFRSGNLIESEKIKLSDASKRLNISLSFYKRILHSKNLAVFAQLAYYGSDNYNIYFQQSSFTARCGLAFAFFEYRMVK